jgi:hypothetical protein
MAILSLDNYIASAKQLLLQKKTASITAVGQVWFSPFAAAGTPGAGTLAGTSTTAGVVPTDATAGCPVINAFTGGAKGYMTRLNAYSSVPGQIMVADILFKAGAYAFNASQALSAQPSYAGRVPGGTDFSGCELWLETVTQFTGNQSIRIQYTDGNDAAQDTGVIATGVAPIVGRMLRLNTVASGVKTVTNVISSVATVGTFNVLVLRPLAYVRIPFAGYSEQRDLYGTGMPEVFADSALGVYVRADSTATGLPELDIEIANG